MHQNGKKESKKVQSNEPSNAVKEIKKKQNSLNWSQNQAPMWLYGSDNDEVVHYNINDCPDCLEDDRKLPNECFDENMKNGPSRWTKGHLQ